MKKLSEFLEIPEGVEFKVNGFENKIYTIKDNTLMYKNAETNDNWHENYDFINLVVQAGKITILSKQILTDTERDYLKAVIKPYKDIPIVIIKDERSIAIEKDREVFYEHYVLAVFDFTKELSFNCMEKDREYRLADLGLEEML